MKRVNIVLAGFGNVGRAFVRLLEDKATSIRERYGLDLKLVAVFKSDGGFLPSRVSGLLGIADLGREAATVHRSWHPGHKVQEVLASRTPGVLVECTPSNFATGEPGLFNMRAALKSGWHVAAASKGALVLKFEELTALARKKRLALKFSGATAAALPTLDVGTISLVGTDVVAIEGILTGVTNHILTRMEDGMSFGEALREAQDQGIAEPDPSLDIDGWDSAAKILLLANAVVGTCFSLSDVRRDGIRRVTPDDVREARSDGRRLKLLARFEKKGARPRAEVRVLPIDETHPLFHVTGTNKGIVFHTDTMGQVTVRGGKSDPRGTAAALLKDIVNIYR